MLNKEFNLVGIAAPTNAGKTTLLTELRQRISPPPTVYSFDEYDRYPSGSQAMERELREQTIVNWEDPSLFDEESFVRDLEKVKQGLPVVLQTRSRESLGRGEGSRIVTPTGLNIVEGVFIYHDPRARDLIDLRFFIDIPVEEMVRRRLARTPTDSLDPWDNLDYIHGEMIKGTEHFVMPQREHAHVLLDGLLPTSELAAMVIAQIDKQKQG